MAQYRIGAIEITNNSQTVLGTGTEWLTNANIGDYLLIVEELAYYTIDSIVSDTELTISVVYPGITRSSVAYAIGRDFTDNLNLPLPYKGDVETAHLIRDGLLKLDNAVDGYLPLTGGTLTGVLNLKNKAFVSAPGVTLPSNPANTLHIFTDGHFSDGDDDAGITIESFEPTIEFKDRSTNAGNFVITADIDTLRFRSDPESDGTYNTMLVIEEDGSIIADGTIQTTNGQMIIQGTTPDTTNAARLDFRNSANTTIGYIGDVSTTQNDIIIKAHQDDIVLDAISNIHCYPQGGAFHIQNAAAGWIYLDVITNVAGTDPIIRLKCSGSKIWAIHHDDSDGNSFQLRRDNAQKLRLTGDIYDDTELKIKAPATNSAAITLEGDNSTKKWKISSSGVDSYLRFQYNNLTQMWMTSNGKLVVPSGYESLVVGDGVLTNKKYVDDAVASTTTNNVVLDNAWVDYGGSYEDVKVIKDSNGFCSLTGLAKNGTSAQICHLPTGYGAPSGILIFSAWTTIGPLRVDVRTDGTIRFNDSANIPNWVSLDGISWFDPT